MRKVALVAIGFLAVAAGIGYLVSAGGVGGGSTGGGTGPAASGAVRAAAPPVSVEGNPALAAAPAGQAAGSTALGSGGAAGAIGILPAFRPDIVEAADLSIIVKKGGFEDAFQTASLVAGRYGGFVESSSTAGIKSRSGRLLMRIPNASFDQALRDLRGLGELEAESISGQDVTSQFVDLQARLRTWQAQESVLLRLMARAASIEETLRVQQNLQDVQFRIEQIRGQLRVLQNQTELATIQVGLREVGAPVGPGGATGNRPSLGQAWDRSLNGFFAVLSTVVVGLGYLVPITALGLVAWAVLRRLQPRPTGGSRLS